MEWRGAAARHGLLIGLGAALLALVLWYTGLLHGWEAATWNWRVRAFAKAGPHSSEVVLVLLDQGSLDWGEQENGLTWPWPREVYVPLVDFCTRSGVRSVAFDVLFTEPSGFGVWDDQALGEALARNGRFVGARFLAHGNSGGDGQQGMPIDEVVAGARVVANVSDQPDEDGVFRHARLWRRAPEDDRRVPSLGTAAWLVGRDALPTADGDWSTLLAGLPVSPDGLALLRYRGTGAYPTYSAASIIQSELRLLEGGQPTVQPGALRDRHVLFGFSAPGLLDLRSTPVSKVSPGVFVHATALDNLLGGDFLRHAGWPAVVAGNLLLAVGLALLTVLAGNRLGVAVAATGLAAAALAVPLAAGFAAYPAGWWWPVLPGAVAGMSAVFGGLVRNYAVEGHQKRFIKQAFKHYLSPAVIERILDNPAALKLGGERRELTIMFSDLAGFTSLSEGLSPEDLTALLNDYLTDMTDIILDEGGTLDKYEGDAIIAFWNAPLDQPDHARRACRAAVRCQRQLAARRDEFRERCGRDLHQRMGLHTGAVVVGNMGSRQRFDYTVLGDAANLASRLEGANKMFASSTMISQFTLDAAPDFRCRRLGPLQVVGRAEPVVVHELVGLPGEAVSDADAAFAAALTTWEDGDAPGAAGAFAQLQDDPVARQMETLCSREDTWVLVDGRRVWKPAGK